MTFKERAVAKSYPFPYLKDTDSTVARSYGARVTPHVFVVDTKGKVRYRGYVDDSAKPQERTHAGLSQALDSLLAGNDVKMTSTKAFGCSIKWKKASWPWISDWGFRISDSRDPGPEFEIQIPNPNPKSEIPRNPRSSPA